MGHKTAEARAAYGRMYRAKHRDRINAQRRPKAHAKYLRNREKALAYYRERRLLHGDEMRRVEKEHRAMNRDARNGKAREWYKQNQEQQRLRKRNYYITNKTAYKAYQKAYVQAHYDSKLRPKALIRYKRYRNNHPEVVVADASKRRALRAKATIDNTAGEFIKAIRLTPFVNCAYCNVQISGKKAHVDHIVSLSRGGSHTASNLCASCPRCNLSKHNRLLTEWTPRAQPLATG